MATQGFSIKYSLNYHLKPKIKGKDKKYAYPICYGLIINRGNYRLKSGVKTYYHSLENISHLDKLKLNRELKLISDVIKYEIYSNYMKFDHKGFGKRLKYYTTSAVDLVRQEIIKSTSEIVHIQRSKFKDLLHPDYILPEHSTIFIEAIQILIPSIKRNKMFQQLSDLDRKCNKLYTECGKENLTIFEAISLGFYDKYGINFIKEPSEKIKIMIWQP